MRGSYKNKEQEEHFEIDYIKTHGSESRGQVK